MLHLPEASIRLFMFLLGFWIEVSLRTLPVGSGAAIHSAGQKLQVLGTRPCWRARPQPPCMTQLTYTPGFALPAPPLPPAEEPWRVQSPSNVQACPPSCLPTLHTASSPLLAPFAHGQPFDAPWPPVVPGPARRAPLLAKQR